MHIDNLSNVPKCLLKEFAYLRIYFQYNHAYDSEYIFEIRGLPNAYLRTIEKSKTLNSVSYTP